MADRSPRHCPGLLVVAAAIASVLLPMEAAALRCGGDLVSEGDPAFQVRDACGAPDHIKPLYPYSSRHSDVGDEIWYYNRGPSSLLRALHFRDGRLRRIRTDERGFREPERAGGCRPIDVQTGMSAYELVARCGEPVQREARHLLRRYHRHGRDYGHRRVWVEDWYYDFGSEYIDRRVRLVDGRVETVDTVD